MTNRPVQLRLLGPLAVRTAAGWEAPRSRLLRTVLATLALADGATVPSATLYAAAWPIDHSGEQQRCVHLAVHRLRRWLAEVNAEATVRTSGGGYALDLPSGETDVARFRALTAAAAKAVSVADASETGGASEACQAGQAGPAVAAGLLTDALALWQGPAFVDLGAAADLDVAQLHRERRAAGLACARAALDAGDPRRALAAASPLAERDPLDEAAQALVIEALASTGRPADAVERYAQVRRQLADDLGVAPGPLLGAVMLALIEGRPVPEDGPAPFCAPCTLPAGIPDFTGREDVLRELHDWYRRDRPRGVSAVLVVAGGPGTGKTALAVHAAQLHRDLFPDGQLYLDLRGSAEPMDPGAAAARLLRALGLPADAVPDDADERSALLRARTVDRRLLLVLDDAADEAQVRPLLPGAGGGVLITSRRALPGLAGAGRIGLGCLAAPEALSLFTSIVGAGRAEREPWAAAAIVRYCAGLPLAIRAAAGRLAGRPDRRLAPAAAELSDERRRLDALRCGDLDVRGSIALSYRALSRHHRHVLRALATLDAAPVPAGFRAAADVKPTLVGEVIADALVDAHLLEPAGLDRDGRPRYRLHDLVRTFARERAGIEDWGTIARTTADREPSAAPGAAAA